MLVFSLAGHTLELEETTEISHRVEWIGWQSGFCAGIMQLKQKNGFLVWFSSCSTKELEEFIELSFGLVWFSPP